MGPRSPAKLKQHMFDGATYSPSYAKQSKNQAWRKRRLERIEHVKFLHEHPLVLYDNKQDAAEEEDGTWRCNGFEYFAAGCKSGQTDFETHSNTLAWRSSGVIRNEDGEEEECDFDLCEMCLRWALYCEKKGRGDKAKTLELFQADDTQLVDSDEETKSPITRMRLVGASRAAANFEWPS